MNIKLYTTPSFTRHMAVIRAEAGQGLENGVRQNAADSGAREDDATITPFPGHRRPSLAEKALAAARTSRDDTSDIGHNERERCNYAARTLRDALHIFREAYGAPDLVIALEMRLAEERRLAARSAPAIRPESAARSCDSILRSMAEQLLEAEGVAKKGGLTQIAGWLRERFESLCGELLPEVRALVAKLEAEARKS